MDGKNGEFALLALLRHRGKKGHHPSKLLGYRASEAWVALREEYKFLLRKTEWACHTPHDAPLSLDLPIRCLAEPPVDG